MEKLRKQMEALMRLCTAEDEESREAARKEIRSMMEGKTASEAPAAGLDVEAEVRRILLELGVPDHLTGHAYLVDAITLAAKDPRQLQNMSRAGGLYETVGKINGTTMNRAERGIRHGVEICWKRCDLNTLYRYFGNITDPDKGKTTNSEFIARLANVVRMRMMDVR